MRYDRQNTERLAKYWLNMEPEDAAKIALELGEGFSARVLYVMKEKSAAPIVAAMSNRGEEGARQAASIMQLIKKFRTRDTTKN